MALLGVCTCLGGLSESSFHPTHFCVQTAPDFAFAVTADLCGNTGKGAGGRAGALLRLRGAGSNHAADSMQDGESSASSEHPGLSPAATVPRS